MEGFRYVDIYATKGIEYLLVLAFLGSFVFFIRYYSFGGGESAIGRRVSEIVEWFRVPSRLYYHQGHTWLRPENDGLVSVGLDDFAQKFVGKVDSIDLPDIGSRLAQGEKGWSLRVNARPIPMLSPVDGEVVSVNEEAIASPDLLNQDPFEKGWLLKIRPVKLDSNKRNLLTGQLARQWTEDALERLRAEIGKSVGPVYQDGGMVGPVYQDGGVPVSGIARALAGEKWEEMVKEYFLTDGVA